MAGAATAASVAASSSVDSENISRLQKTIDLLKSELAVHQNLISTLKSELHAAREKTVSKPSRSWSPDIGSKSRIAELESENQLQAKNLSLLRSDAEANLSTIAKMRDEIKSNSIIRPAATIPQPASFFFQDGLVCWRHCCGSDCDILF